MASEASPVVEDLHKEPAMGFTSTAAAQNPKQRTALTSQIWGEAQVFTCQTGPAGVSFPDIYKD